MYTVIFVEPETPGNIGAIARSMANFGLSKLILINPKCDLKSDECKGRAKHAYKLIENARILTNFEKAIEEFDIVIGTTGKQTSDYDFIRTGYTPKELKKNIQETKGKKAIVIGREGTGLTNDELSKCSFMAHIQTDKKYPVLNASHAAAILFYELASPEYSSVRKSDSKQTNVLIKNFEKIINENRKIRDKETMKKTFSNIIKRSTISSRESNVLIGFFKSIRDNK